MAYEWKERTGERIHRGKKSKYAPYWREREEDIHKLLSGELEYIDVRSIVDISPSRKSWVSSISFTKIYVAYGIAAHLVALAKFVQTLIPGGDDRYIARINNYGELTIHKI